MATLRPSRGGDALGDFRGLAAQHRRTLALLCGGGWVTGIPTATITVEIHEIPLTDNRITSNGSWLSVGAG
jgi:hypothetical protein